MKFKKLNDNLLKKVSEEAKMLLHAERDCMRNQRKNTLNIGFSVMGSYYAEAFGMFRTLILMNYGDFASSNLDGLDDPFTKFRAHRKEQNFKWYFNKLEKEVLEEEGFYLDHRCEHCLKKYRKDDKSLIEKGKLKKE